MAPRNTTSQGGAAVEEPAREMETGAEIEREPMDLSGHRLEIRGPARGRWRAGRHFTAEPTVIEPGVLTRAEREAIEDDPELSVRATETDSLRDA